MNLILVLKCFLGKKTDFISGENKKSLTMISVKTGFVFPCFSRGKIDWNLVIQSMSECEERNDLITDIISSFTKKKEMDNIYKKNKSSKSSRGETQ